ncbi:MAG: hypothetical protein FWD67_11690 [Betaproteobacteria bacterium]|nr:hypothetical protein [Betaproteobacteria bacterium]
MNYIYGVCILIMFLALLENVFNRVWHTLWCLLPAMGGGFAILGSVGLDACCCIACRDCILQV